ncbi:transposase (fragment) [Klebsiella variicola]
MAVVTKSNRQEGNMSRRGNCHDNVVAESFPVLKHERIKKKSMARGKRPAVIFLIT